MSTPSPSTRLYPEMFGSGTPGEVLLTHSYTEEIMAQIVTTMISPFYKEMP